MSRSRKKTPVQGITMAGSEKEDKRRYNRRFRRVVKQKIHIDPYCEILPHLYEYSDPWGMDKDGKSRFNSNEHPEWMRK